MGQVMKRLEKILKRSWSWDMEPMSQPLMEKAQPSLSLRRRKNYTRLE